MPFAASAPTPCSFPSQLRNSYRIIYSRLSGEEIPSYFASGLEARSVLLAKEWLGEGDTTALLRSGIAIHHGSLPEILKKSIEQDFRQRKYRVIVATNTLAQGVNLPIRTVIIHSCKRYIQETGFWERIPARDYWNIAGRAGRAGEETAGLTIHITLNDDDQTDYRYYSERKDNVEPVESAVFQKLRELVNNRITEEALKAELDPEILGVLAEESESISREELVQEFTLQGLAHVQIANKRPEWLAILQRVMRATADELVAKVSNSDMRKLYGMTGLNSASCLTISKDIERETAKVHRLFQQANEANLDEFVAVFLSTCSKLTEMVPRRTFSGNHAELLSAWIRGTSTDELIKEFSQYAENIDNFSLFIDDLFRYRLPWGISSYIRIAKSVLKLDSSQISDYVKFFPAMVKFGVSSAAACWAMSLGFPSRQIAMQFAAMYEDETSTLSYKGFLEWITTLAPERLQNDFGLQGYPLEDISRSILTFSVNPLLQEHYGVSLLPIEVQVQGIKYDNRDIVALRCTLGDSVEISRDYDNLLDRNALAIYWRKQQVGYVPRDVAEVLAVEVDTGTMLHGEITSIDKMATVPKISVRIAEQLPQTAPESLSSV